MEEWLAAVLTGVVALAGSPWVFVALFAMATIDGFFPPIPSESVVIALASLAVSTGEPNLWIVAAVAAAGAFTGDQIAFTIGRRVDVRRLRFLQGRRQQQALHWAERALEQRGATFIIAARYVPVGRVAVNMTAGAIGFPRRRFVALAAIAAVSWAAYSTALGIGAGLWLKDHPLLGVVVGVAGGLLLGTAIDPVIRWLAARGNGRPDAAAAPTVGGASATEVPTSGPVPDAAAGHAPGQASVPELALSEDPVRD